MTVPLRLKHFGFLCLLYSLLQAVVAAQKCYYPNGDVSTGDVPCSSGKGSACCPINWQCLDNGLCYLQNAGYFGRYTYNTDAGDQAVLQCSNHGGQYCCDHNRDVNNVCCDQTDSKMFFSLPQGNPFASIPPNGDAVAVFGANAQSPSTQDNAAPVSSAAGAAVRSITNPATTIKNPASSVQSSVSNAVAGASSATSAPSITSSKTTTIVHSSTQSGQNGQTSIVLLTSVITTGAPAPQITSPSAATNTTATSNQSSNAAAIGGGVGGGAAALLLLSALTFFLLKRRRRRKERELNEATMHRPQAYLADQKDMEYMYKGHNGGAGAGTPYTGTTAAADVEGGSPEIDGTEITPKLGGRAFRPGEATRVDNKVAKESGPTDGLGLEPESPPNRNRLSELPGSRPTTGYENAYPAQGKWERYGQAGRHELAGQE
ncbi:MAG: hypothetical protein Q9218_004091 [Villophora microphyllina]